MNTTEDASNSTEDTVEWRVRARCARKAAARERDRVSSARAVSRADRLTATTDRRRSAIDELTGAYRRETGMVEIAHDFDTARDTGQSMVLCSLDVNGHAGGDRTLRRVADSVRAHLRHDDTIVRYADDHFVFAVVGLDEQTVLDRTRAMDTRLRIEHGISITCGISTVTGSLTVDAAIELAEDDLCRRRRDTDVHRTRIAATPPANDGYVPSPLVGDAVESVLSDPQSVQSSYQPIVDLATGSTIGFEALARWPHLATVDTAEVFTTAAARGVLPSLDWAAHLAAIEGALDAGMTPHHRLFVNVEPDSLNATPEYARELIRAAADRLTIVVELTERSLLADPATLLAQIHQARADGCTVALDDVGANPDTLTLLEFIAPDIIKLDRTLVRHDPTPTHARILAAIRAHVDATGAVLLAEGIETAEHLERATAYGCTLGQGWMFGRPSPLPTDIARTHTGPAWTPPTRRTVGPLVAHVPALPGDVLGHVLGCRPPTVGRKSLIIALTRQIEEHAAETREPLTILSTFQKANNFRGEVAARYEKLAATNPFVAALGVGMGTEPATGVRGTDLHPDEPLTREWVITVVGHHHFAALIARDLGDTCADADRTFEFLHTFDRDIVVGAARSLMQRVLPAQSTSLAPSPVASHR